MNIFPITPNNGPREYQANGYIDFTRQVHNWPVRGDLHIYVHAFDLVNLLKMLFQMSVLDSFSMKIHNTFVPSSVLVEFKCVSAIGHRVDAGLAALLTIAGEYSTHMTWVEGEYSYRIEPSGRILVKHKIEDGGC